MRTNGCQARPGAVQIGVVVGVACLLAPSIAQANPVDLNPASLLSFSAVAFWALVVEAGVVALLLLFNGLAVLRVFFAYLLTNGLVFLFIFLPLLDRKWSVPALELLVVLIDGTFIKLLASLQGFQGDQFKGVSWLRSAAIAGVGNATSFFVGYIASRKPWES